MAAFASFIEIRFSVDLVTVSVINFLWLSLELGFIELLAYSIRNMFFLSIIRDYIKLSFSNRI